MRARGVSYIKLVRYYDGIWRLGGVHNSDPLRAQVCSFPTSFFPPPLHNPPGLERGSRRQLGPPLSSPKKAGEEDLYAANQPNKKRKPTSSLRRKRGEKRGVGGGGEGGLKNFSTSSFREKKRCLATGAFSGSTRHPISHTHSSFRTKSRTKESLFSGSGKGSDRKHNNSRRFYLLLTIDLLPLLLSFCILRDAPPFQSLTHKRPFVTGGRYMPR